jgi:hypothetical protein
VQPDATVIAAGLSPAVGVDAPPNFLNDMYIKRREGLLRRNRHVSLRVSPAASSRTRAVRSGQGARHHDVERRRRQEGRVDRVRRAHECAERGWVSQQEQAKQITDLLAGAAATGRSGPALIYSIRDIDSANPDDREDNFGALLTMDWQPKYAAACSPRSRPLRLTRSYSR